MKKSFLLLLLMTLLPLASWADSYEVKVRAKAVEIQYGVATPDAVQADMFIVTDWAGYPGDADDKASITASIKNLLSFTTQRAADSDLGNYAFTLSVADGEFVEKGDDYIFINIANANGTFKQIASTQAAVVTAPTANAAENLVYTGEEIDLFSANGSAAFGDPALLSNLPLVYRVKLSTEEWGGQEWTEGVPVAIAAATYNIQYKAKHDDRFADGEAVDIDITVATATAAFTVNPTPAENLIYDGTAQPLFTAAGTLNFPDDLTAHYYASAVELTDAQIAALTSADGVDDITTLTGTDAGTYYIYYEFISSNNNVEADNYHYRNSGWTVTIAPGANALTVAFTGDYEEGEVTFDRNEWKNRVTFSVKAGDTDVDVASTDYTVEWKKGNSVVTTVKDAGTYTMTVTGTGNYEGATSEPLTFVVNKKDLADGTFTAVADQTYTGSQIKPTPSLKITGQTFGSTLLNYTYGENVNAGEGAGTITVTMKSSVDAAKNYTGSQTMTFNIAALSITDNDDITFDAIEAQEYAGEQITPAVSNVKFGEATMTLAENAQADGDYYLTYGDNLNVGATAGTVTINGKGNFTGTKTANFEITKATLTAKVADATKSFGQVDPTPEVTITGFKGNDEQTLDLTGAYTVARTNTSEDPGTYAWTVTDAGTLTNYEIKNADPQGALTINNATVFIRPQNTEKTYGYALPALDKDAFTFQAAGLTSGEVTALTFTVKDADDNEYAEGDVLDAGEYTITASEATVSAGSYTFDYTTTATLTIAQKELSLTANNQTIEYGGAASTTVIYDAGETQTVVADGRVGNDDLGISLEIAANATSIGIHEGAITINVENLNENYVLAANNPVAGNLIITAPAAAAIALGEGGDDLQTIKDYAGQPVNVTINFANRNGRTLGGERNWVKENWVTLTLPFDITVAELSQKLGYAIVNEINPERTVVNGTSSEFYGKLTMKGAYGEEYLPANKPILVKITDDIANVGNAGKVDFGSQLIVAPTDLTVDAGQGAKFVGSYASKTVTSADDVNIWFMIGGGYDKWAYITTTSTNSWTIVPFEAYIDMSNLPAGARSMTFYFEEIDGTKTAIKSIDADNLNARQNAEGMYNLNGMKLNSVPTQKGIYIQNGKKVVIK